MAKVWTIVAAVALALLLVGSIVVAVLESEEPFEAGTAEAAVQDLLRALEDDEFETAYGLLSAELKEECSAEQAFGFPFRYRDQFDQNRITLEQKNEVGGATLVTVRVSSFEGSGPSAAPSPRFYSATPSGKQGTPGNSSSSPGPYTVVCRPDRCKWRPLPSRMIRVAVRRNRFASPFPSRIIRLVTWMFLDLSLSCSYY